MKSGRGRSSNGSYAEALQEMTLRYERLVQDLSILRRINQADDPDLAIDDVCRQIVETVASGLGVENCSMMLMTEEGEAVELRAACSPLEDAGKSFGPGAWQGRTFRVGEGIVGKVAETGEAIRVDDVVKDERFVPAPESSTPVRSLLCFPLEERGRVVGVLNLSHSEPGFFSAETEKTMALVAERAAGILADRALHQKLRESEAYYRLVAENAGDGILVFDGLGQIVSVNPAVQQITGIPALRYLLGETDWEAAVHPDDQRRFAEHRNRLLSEQRPETIEYRRLDARGRIHYLEERSSPLVGFPNAVTGAVSVVRDVTDRKQAEEERRRLDAEIQYTQKLESLGALTGGLAHDFNNLLMGIIGNVDLALMDLAAVSPIRENIENIAEAARKAAHLCRQMLTYSGKGYVSREWLDLSEVVRNMVGLLQVSVPENVRLEYALARALPPVEGDATQIRQLVMNLVTNAAEAIGERTGVIRIATDRVERESTGKIEDRNRTRRGKDLYVCVRVADTGCGMDENTRQRAFDPFFTTKFIGRGLGLAAVSGIARAHNALVEVDSTPGEGATFTVLFPISDAPGERDETT
ncbi:MAG TPA: PAS domain S-box protein [Candidatus Hydrogenedentes bacterium]|nr:PAS domain S-box protein [Candidatus Hydrogenedentota bacterium]